jgi:hypothetical protein
MPRDGRRIGLKPTWGQRDRKALVSTKSTACVPAYVPATGVPNGSLDPETTVLNPVRACVQADVRGYR